MNKNKKVVPRYDWVIWSDNFYSHVVVEDLHLNEPVANFYSSRKDEALIIKEAKQLISDLDVGRITKKSAQEKYPKK